MTRQLTIGLIKGSLPSYFPERHGVFAAAEAMLAQLCEREGARLVIAPSIPMDGRDTRKAVDGLLSEGADFILLLHGGFTMGDVARTLAASPVRCGFWSTPEPRRVGDIQLNNFVSLNMSMSIAAKVRNLETHPVQWYHGAPDSQALQARLGNTIRALRAAHALDQARIGVVGGLAMTFYNMEISTNALRQRLGVETFNHDIGELVERMAAIEPSRVSGEVAAMLQAAPADSVSPAQLDLTGRAVLAMRDIAATNDYSALTVSDWPALQANPGMHPGAAFSWLEQEDGLPVASEGDILGAVTQLVAKSVTGKVGYLLDMTEPDLNTGQLLMWHGGGGPLYLADEAGVRWVNHPMIGRGTEAGPIHGAISDLVFRDGPVTVFRIARDAGAFFGMTAEVNGRDPSGFTGCRGWLDHFSVSGEASSLEDVVATVMSHGLEHHFVLVPGNAMSVLSELASWTGMQTLRRRPMRDHLDSGDYIS